MKNNQSTLKIEGARIFLRNFSGAESKFNRAGDRNFCVVIDSYEDALALQEAGWNVKAMQPREEGEEPTYYLKVSVSYLARPPKVVMFVGENSKKGIYLDQESLGNLDYADIIKTKIAINPYHWEAAGKTGIKAYLKTLHVWVEEEDFAEDFAEEESPEE